MGGERVSVVAILCVAYQWKTLAGRNRNKCDLTLRIFQNATHTLPIQYAPGERLEGRRGGAMMDACAAGGRTLACHVFFLPLVLNPSPDQRRDVDGTVSECAWLEIIALVRKEEITDFTAMHTQSASGVCCLSHYVLAAVSELGDAFPGNPGNIFEVRTESREWQLNQNSVYEINNKRESRIIHYAN